MSENDGSRAGHFSDGGGGGGGVVGQGRQSVGWERRSDSLGHERLRAISKTDVRRCSETCTSFLQERCFFIFFSSPKAGKGGNREMQWVLAPSRASTAKIWMRAG